MDTLLRSRWWTFVARAAVVALFGIAVLSRQGRSLEDFSLWFGIAAIVNGLIALGATVVRFDAGNPWGDPGWDGTPTFAIDPPWRSLAAEAVLSFVIGLVVLVTPVTGEHALFALIAALTFSAGITQVLTTERLGHLAAGWEAMGIGAVVSFCTGVIALATVNVAVDDRMTVVAVASLIEAAVLVIVGAALRHLERTRPIPRGMTVLAAELVPAARHDPRSARQQPAS